MGLFFKCEQMASLGKMMVWYGAINVGRKGSASAGALSLFSELVSCKSLVNGNRESHWTEVPARGNCPRYCRSISVLEL